MQGRTRVNGGPTQSLKALQANERTEIQLSL